MKEKPCIRCSKVLPLSEFYVHAQMGDGHLNKCKACCKANALKHRGDNLERIRAYDLARSKRAERKANTVKQTRKARSARKAINPAHMAVARALRNGALTRQPCEVCGTTRAVHAHHDDYAKPLDVRWLCAAHHADWHKINGYGKNAVLNTAEERQQEKR